MAFTEIVKLSLATIGLEGIHTVGAAASTDAIGSVEIALWNREIKAISILIRMKVLLVGWETNKI